MGGEPGEEPKNPQDVTDILENAQRLLASQTANRELFNSNQDSYVDIEATGMQAEQLSLSSAEAGDVVWWKTSNGTTGCFVIEEPYTDEGNDTEGMRRGNGEFLITRRTGHRLGNQRGAGRILGAINGNEYVNNAVLKGVSLEYQLRTGEEDKKYATAPVTDMGVIRASRLAPK